MLCPCCGEEMKLDARQCDCGARIVGEPLSEPIARIRLCGPVLLSLGLFAIVVTAAAAFTLWASVAGALVLVAAHRAMRLARDVPDGSAGYRTARGVLAVALLLGLVLSAYAISRVPRYLDNRKTRESARTSAAMSELAYQAAMYRAKVGYYPPNDNEFRRFMGKPLPTDSWDTPLSYFGFTGDVADATPRRDAGGPVGIPVENENFELRSAGPDGLLGTEDDIVMRDGVFYSDAEIIKNPIRKNPLTR